MLRLLCSIRRTQLRCSLSSQSTAGLLRFWSGRRLGTQAALINVRRTASGSLRFAAPLEATCVATLKFQAETLLEEIEVGPYLSKLCATLADSMIGEKRSVSVEVSAEEGTASSSAAVSIGLIVTEGMINALKHAFPPDTKDGRIAVAYKVNGLDWRLSIADNGVGKLNQWPRLAWALASSMRWRSSSMRGLIWSLDRRAQS